MLFTLGALLRIWMAHAFVRANIGGRWSMHKPVVSREILIAPLCIFLAAQPTGLFAAPAAEAPALLGFSADSSRVERETENQFRALPDRNNLREYMQRLSARPHHVGSPYDKDNAGWMLAKFKEWGWDAKIENYDVLFPTPKERLLELTAPTHFTAKLQEPPVKVDPTSAQQDEQLPS